MHNDEEVRIRNRARLIGDPDLKLLLDEISRLRTVLAGRDRQIEIMENWKKEREVTVNGVPKL